MSFAQKEFVLRNIWSEFDITIYYLGMYTLYVPPDLSFQVI